MRVQWISRLASVLIRLTQSTNWPLPLMAKRRPISPCRLSLSHLYIHTYAKKSPKRNTGPTALLSRYIAHLPSRNELRF